MSFRLARLFRLLFVLALPARGQLPQRSPFLPAEGDPTVAAVAPAFEFSGYIEAANGVQYRVNDTARKTEAWLRLNEASPELNLVARRHDQERELLVVEHQGRSLTLPLKRAKTVSSGPATKTAAVAPVVIPTLATPNANLPSDLEKLAAAVAERRAARAAK